MKKCIVYIGDFDLRNENVQAHLVRNNGKIFSALGYEIAYIGVHREKNSHTELAGLSPVALPEGERYFELPNTLNLPGVARCRGICRQIIGILNELKGKYSICHVITYQCPTYAVAIKQIAKWCGRNQVSYIVNCADLPIFDLQSPVKKAVMKWNWRYLHRVNHKYADGVIAVSQYIDEFYRKDGRPSIVVPPLFETDRLEFNATPNELPTFIYAGTPFVLTGHEAAPSGMKDRLDGIIDRMIALSATGVRYQFQIVGIDKEAYLCGVPRHREALEKERQIEFLGRQPHAKALALLKQADFSINYRDENLMTKAGFSTKIVESISVGTPVIINRISDTFHYLEDGRDAFALSGEAEKDEKLLVELCALSKEERLSLKRQIFERRIFDLSHYVWIFESFLSEQEIRKGNTVE